MFADADAKEVFATYFSGFNFVCICNYHWCFTVLDHISAIVLR